MSSPDGLVPPAPTVVSSPSFDASSPNVAAVAATVTIVAVLLVITVTWLALRLRRARRNNPTTARRPASYPSRPSLAPSEASSRFGFIRKSLRLSRRTKDASWDFADPDPFASPKEASLDTPTHRPAPLPPTPAYIPRAQRTSTFKDDTPRTPTTPATPDSIGSPPPAYCREARDSAWPAPPC